jgi:hypothetical protein
MTGRELADANRERRNTALAEGREHFEQRTSHQLWRHPDTGRVVRAERLTGEQLARAEFVGHEVTTEACRVDRYDRVRLRRPPQILKSMQALTYAPLVRRTGHAPRMATNTHSRGSKRTSTSSRGSPDDDPGEPGEHRDPHRGGDHLETPRAVAKLRVRRERRVFEATVCVVSGQLVYVVGRWRDRYGPNYSLVDWSAPRSYTFSAAEIERVRWLKHELALLDGSAEAEVSP